MIVVFIIAAVLGAGTIATMANQKAYWHEKLDEEKSREVRK